MRILLIMDPLIAVPPRHYGGIERVVADLADELVHRGHEVTLWAAPGSHIDGALEPFGHEGEWTRWSNARNTAVLTARFLRRPGAYDVVHNFGRLAYLTTVLSRNVPKVQTYMRRVNPDNMRRASSLGARRLNRRLIIAGNLSTLPEEREYFHSTIEPAIDGQLVSYIGPVDDRQKDELLGSAAAFLLPIEWLEPFPVVLPEALLCGTPVVAFRQGGVPEGIDHGRTGFVCDTVDEMVAAIGRLDEIDRAECRAEGGRRFSTKTIVDDYERLYVRLHAD